MSPRDLVALLSLLAALGSAFLANVFIQLMAERINQKGGAEVPPFMPPPVMVRVFREYRSLYPAGRLHVYLVTAMLSAALSMLVFAVSFGFVPFF